MDTTTDKSIKRRTIEAARRYLSRSGYELRSTWGADQHFGFVAIDDGTVTFVRLISNGIDEDSFPEMPAMSRRQFEQVAIKWFADCGDDSLVDMPIRFDVLSLKVLCEDRALVKHEVNALGIYRPHDFDMHDMPCTCM